jgi:hypothetical protein
VGLDRCQSTTVPLLAVPLFSWLLFAVIWVALALRPARVAAHKEHSFFGCFVFSVFFFPLALTTAYMVQGRGRPGTA